MNKLKLLIIILLTSCGQQRVEFPMIEIEPLSNAFKKNHINGYVKLWSIDGDLEKQDSVRINENGLITDRISISGYWYSVTNVQYDSLGRKTRLFHDSDINYTYSISYFFDEEERMVEQRWKDVSSIDTLELWTYNFHYGDSFKRPTKMIRLDDNLDTISVTYYSYSGFGITSIQEISDSQIFKKSYIYDEDSPMIQITKELNGKLLETDFISHKTGLIDSTVHKQEGIFYYQYF